MATGRYVVPTPQPASTLGMLNLILGGIFLLSGMFGLSSALATPILQKPYESIADASKAQIAKDHEAVLAKLKALEDAAESDAERQVYLSSRQKLEEEGPPGSSMASVMTTGFRPEFVNFYWLDALTGIPLNLALMAAGVGLIQLEEWGRKLALWVAGLKIVRILAVQGYWIFGIVPGFAQSIGDSVKEMLRQTQAAGGGGAPVPFDFTMLYLVMYTVIGVLTILFVCVYPIISLVVLRRDGVRAACLAAAQAEAAAKPSQVDAELP